MNKDIDLEPQHPDALADQLPSVEEQKMKVQDELHGQKQRASPEVIARRKKQGLMGVCLLIILAIVTVIVVLVGFVEDREYDAAYNSEKGFSHNSDPDRKEANSKQTLPPKKVESSSSSTGTTTGSEEVFDVAMYLTPLLANEELSNENPYSSTTGYQYQAARAMAQDTVAVANKNNVAKLLQRYALYCLYYSTGSSTWQSTQDWNLPSDRDECEWYGVSCGDTKTVEALDLPNAGLVGNIPQEIKLVKQLERLNLSKNKGLNGNFPWDTLTEMSLLHQMNLDSTGYTGASVSNSWCLAHPNGVVEVDCSAFTCADSLREGCCSCQVAKDVPSEGRNSGGD